MKTKRTIHPARFLISLLITTILFIGTFTFGYFIAYRDLDDISLEQNKLLNSFLELQLEKELIKSSCQTFDISHFSEDLNEMGSYMGLIEKKLGKTDPSVLEQKKIYTMLQVQHMLLIEQQIRECNSNHEIILFFYSNHKESLDKATEMGFIISSFREKNENVLVYSFDYDLDMTLLETLKVTKGITKPNSLLYKDKYFTDLQNINELNEEKAFKITKETSKPISLN